MDTLKPIIEAAHLLQARKTDEDVDSVCEMCGSLSAQQICKILTLYTPADEYEPRVPTTFIRKVQAKLAERQEAGEQKVCLLVQYNLHCPLQSYLQHNLKLNVRMCQNNKKVNYKRRTLINTMDKCNTLKEMGNDVKNN